MLQTVSTLFHLQELELIRDESRIVHHSGAPDDLAGLEKEIAAVRADMDESALKRYDLLRRSGAAVVRVPGGICNGCRLSVSKGDLNRMRKNQIPPVCPNCGRFLFFDESERN